MTLEGPPPDLGPWGEGEPEPNPPAGHPLASKAFKVEIDRAQPAPGDLSGSQLVPTYHLPGVPTQVLLEELTRRFQGVAVVGIQVAQVSPHGPFGAMECVARDMYYTSVRGLPMPMLAGCLLKLSADLQSQAARVEIKPT
jgi:hypothetical protein